MSEKPITHELKTDSDLFEEIWKFRKLYEVRVNDRNFNPGDNVVLMETVHSREEMKKGKDLEYTGRRITGTIGHLIDGSKHGMRKGWCVFSLLTSRRLPDGF